MAKNKGLGKGLDALLKMNVQEDFSVEAASEESAAVAEGAKSGDENVVAGFVEVDLAHVIPDPNQPRKDFDEEALEQLSISIKNFGLIQPITVTKKDDSYHIVAGERRYRAAKMAGLEKIPVIIKDLTQRERFEVSIVENIQRENLNAIEEALAYSSLIDNYELTQEELSGRIGKSRTAVTNILRLLNLDPQIQKWIIDAKVTPGHARAILSVSDISEHVNFAAYIIEKNLSVREAEQLSKKWPLPAKPKKKEAPPREVELQRAEERLEQKLQTKIKIKGSSHRGKIAIEYFSIDELERLMDFFGVDVT